MARDRTDARTFSEFTRRTWLVLGATVSVVVILLVLLRLSHVLLLLFAGALFAIFLRGLSRPLASRMNISETLSLVIVVLLIVLVLAAGSVLLAPSVGNQISSLVVALPEAWDSATEYLRSREWGTWLMDSVPQPGEVADGGGGLVSNFFGVFSTAIGVIANALFVIVLGVYLAMNPSMYWKGIVLLVPERKRDRAAEIVRTLGDQLWQWLKGQFIMMAIVGTLTGIGLKIAGVPLALGLGVVAGLFEFVPILGPFAAAIPGILIALAHDPTTALYALIVYVVVQQLEGNVLAPLVMREMVSLPPALTLSSTVIAGVMFGVVGVLLATPLALVVIILVRMIYVSDVLGDDVPPVPKYAEGEQKS